MAWENVVDKIGKRLHGDVCPNCGALWEDMTSCSNCGYSPKIIACPKCATIKECRSIYTNKMLLTHPEKVSYLDSCKCNVPYVELNMTNEEYDQMWLDHLNYETWWPDWWRRSACTLANFVAARYVFENLFDKSQLDTNLSQYKSNYADMYPESKESAEYYKDVGGIEISTSLKTQTPLLVPSTFPNAPSAALKISRD